MRSLGCTLIQYEWCPYKKRRLEHAQKEDHEKTQRDNGHL